MKIILKTLNGTTKEINFSSIPTLGEVRTHIGRALNRNWDDITVRNILDKNNTRIGSIYLDDPGEINFSKFLFSLNNNPHLELKELTFFITDNLGLDHFRPAPNMLKKVSEQKLLPILIFAENHYDTITKDILSKLIPILKELGYSCYYEEDGESQTLETRISQMRQIEKSWINLQNEIKEKYNQDIDFSSINAFFHPLLPKVLDKNNIYDFIGFISYKCFYYAIRSNQISFKGIDLEMSEIKNLSPIDESINEETMKIRDQKMANAFLNSSQNTFGKVGLLHVAGIQKHLLESLTLETAKKRYKFIHLYTHQTDLMKKHIQTTQFPLDISCIHSSLKEADEIIKSILMEITAIDSGIKSSFKC